MGGLPKGLLAMDGEPIAGRAVRLFQRLFEGALIVANDPAPYAALSAAPTEWIFTAACDMPFLSEGPIRWLAERRGDAPAVLVRFGGRLHPLHACWSRACLPVLDRLLREGDPSLRELARVVGARVIEEPEWRTVDPAGRALENANTPEDAARLGLALGGPGRGPDGDTHSH